MKSIVFLFSFLFLFSLSMNAQLPVNGQDEQPIMLQKPSFEDFPKLSHTPSGWFDCGFPGESEVDIHPVPASEFQVDKTAYDGEAYLGMVVRENETWEAIGQRLTAPLNGGNCYEFSIHLARSSTYLSGLSSSGIDIASTTTKKVNFATPIKLRIWGGNGYCKKAELLAESSLVINTRWLEFNFRFEPKQTYGYITFEAFYKTPCPFPYNGNILLDNAQPIVPVPCDDTLVAVADPIPVPDKPEPTDPFATNTKPTTPQPEIVPTQPKATSKYGSKDKFKVGQTILVKNLQFDADSTRIPPRSYEAMAELLDFLTENGDLKIEIGGHTNGQPAKEYCDYISNARAKTVADYLIQRGISSNRLKYVGYGKDKPIASNRTAYGRKQNQRVEIKILGFDG